MKIKLIKKEGHISTPLATPDTNIRGAASMAKQLAQKLETGEYIRRIDPIPTFFIKLQAWEQDIDIEELDLKETHQLRLTNGYTVNFNEDHINGDLKDKDRFRLILLAENGMTSFLVFLNGYEFT